jgi:hypothetical protein
MGKVSKPKIKHEKKRSGCRGWATPEQEAWLRKQIPSYLAAKDSSLKNLSDFWLPMWVTWSNEWPDMLLTLTTEDKERVQAVIEARKLVS